MKHACFIHENMHVFMYFHLVPTFPHDILVAVCSKWRD